MGNSDEEGQKTHESYEGLLRQRTGYVAQEGDWKQEIDIIVSSYSYQEVTIKRTCIKE